MEVKEDNKKSVSLIEADACYVFECPNCESLVQVERNQVNCRIFRHGTMKNTYTIRFDSGLLKLTVPLNDIEDNDSPLSVGDKIKARPSPMSPHESGYIAVIHEGQQLGSHAPQQVCDDLVARDLIWGCGKPFLLHHGSDGKVEFATRCGYI